MGLEFYRLENNTRQVVHLLAVQDGIFLPENQQEFVMDQLAQCLTVFTVDSGNYFTLLDMQAAGYFDDLGLGYNWLELLTLEQYLFIAKKIRHVKQFYGLDFRMGDLNVKGLLHLLASSLFVGVGYQILDFCGQNDIRTYRFLDVGVSSADMTFAGSKYSLQTQQEFLSSISGFIDELNLVNKLYANIDINTVEVEDFSMFSASAIANIHVYNRIWPRKIVDILNKHNMFGEVFVVVPLLQLMGDDNILHNLHDLGFNNIAQYQSDGSLLSLISARDEAEPSSVSP